MIKLIIFDLDGVLVDAKEIHYEALNDALRSIDPKYVINRDEHLSTYDGLNTTKKLSMLSERKGLPVEMHSQVWQKKQSSTVNIIDSFTPDERLRSVLSRLKKDGYTICVASNSIRDTVKMMLLRKGFIEYIDFFYSNQDVKTPKPNPEIYLRCMIKANVSPKETLIIEDSHIGRKAALDSGAFLCPVVDSYDVTYDKINDHVANHNEKTETSPKWQGGKMKVLIPMAGAGSRFSKAGYTFPKPLIEVKGKPMIQVIVENLNIDAQHIFIVQKEHYEKYHLKTLLNLVSPGCEIVQVDGLTEGAACTTLLAKEFIDNDNPLLIANSDQYIEWDSNEFMYSMCSDFIDGGVLSFRSTHPKWSFAKLDKDGYVEHIAEKEPISDIATVGIYFWKKGSDYVKYSQDMINDNERINNEFYVAPVYNRAIAEGKKVKTFDVNGMWGIGTPEDLSIFLKSRISDHI
jgi:HAD superfamily hydrolase (TIGR01509 family)